MIYQTSSKADTLLGVQGVRKLLSLGVLPVIGSGVVDKLLELMSAEDSEPLLQCKARLALNADRSFVTWVSVHCRRGHLGCHKRRFGTVGTCRVPASRW
jgi:hypothetical protein